MIGGIVGIIGAVLIAIGWIAEILKVIKDKKSKIDWKFGLLYFIGSLMLVIYSFQINSLVFILLNSLIAVLEVITLMFSLRKF